MRICSQDFHFLSPKECGGDDDRIKRGQNMAQQMFFLLNLWLGEPRAGGDLIRAGVGYPGVRHIQFVDSCSQLSSSQCLAELEDEAALGCADNFCVGCPSPPSPASFVSILLLSCPGD